MIGIVVTTHCGVASALVEAAVVVLGPQDGLVAVDIGPEDGRDVAFERLRDAVAVADRGAGVLLLADALGGTPANLALALLAEAHVEVVTGVNLPMVLRALQHRADHDLPSLTDDVLAYGRRNVVAASTWLRKGGGA